MCGLDLMRKEKWNEGRGSLSCASPKKKEKPINPEPPDDYRSKPTEIEITSSTNIEEAVYCVTCQMWLNGDRQFEEHKMELMHLKRVRKKAQAELNLRKFRESHD